MLRFKPDGVLEGLLRPLTLIDPVAGIYLEIAAPDWRFAAALALFTIGLFAGHCRVSLDAARARFLAAMVVAFWTWTFAVGNGRYFAFGLLLAGPLTVLAWRQLPGTLAFRSTALAGLVLLQLWSVSQNYPGNPWGLVRWFDGPGLPVRAVSLRDKPAVFLTVSSISYSLLAPRFHPQSRWANITGQRDITRESKEYPRLLELLSSPLPVFLVARATEGYIDRAGQPVSDLGAMFKRSLAENGLGPTGERCEIVRSPLASPPQELGARSEEDGFWFCPVKLLSAPPVSASPDKDRAAELTAVFAAVEARCPRFFPPRDGQQRQSEGMVLRYYPGSDVRLYIDGEGRVSYKYFRAFNPTLIGTVEQVRSGDFTIPCEKLPGRYQLPWQRE